MIEYDMNIPSGAIGALIFNFERICNNNLFIRVKDLTVSLLLSVGRSILNGNLLFDNDSTSLHNIRPSDSSCNEFISLCVPSHRSKTAYRNKYSYYRR
jgi:hypothetical protein